MKALSYLVMALVVSLAGCSGGSQSRPDGGEPDGGWEEVSGEGDVTEQDAGEQDEGPVVLRLDDVLPSRGPVQGGTWVNIVGAGFVEGIAESPFGVRDVTLVTFGDNPALDLEVVRDDMISVRTPPGPAGSVTVAVENPNGRVELEDAFTYYEQVIVDTVQPLDLSSRGGTAIRATGSGFTQDTVLIVGGRRAASCAVTGSTRVDCLAPPGAPGLADVEVVNRNGRRLLFRAVRYHAVPSLLGAQPAAGPPSGGTVVTLAGEGFEQDTKVRFGAAGAAAVELVDSTTLRATSPAGVAGPVDLVVDNTTDTARLEGGFFYLPEPTGSLGIAGTSPASGPTTGGITVTLVGEGFSAGVDRLTLGSAQVSSFTIVDDRTVSFSLPLAATEGTVDVELEQSGNVVRASGAFRYYEPLSLSSVSPSSAPDGGGVQFELAGAGFHEGVEVLFGGVPATGVQVIDDGHVTGTVPAGSPGPVDVEVRDSDSRAVLEGAFTYTSGLSLVRVEPDSGSQAGGTYVVIYGSGFAPGARVYFGGNEASVVQVESENRIAVRTPRGVPGEVDVEIRLGDDSALLEAGFSYFDPTNDRGGASGGPLSGSFNLTALDGSWTHWGEPVAGATVSIDPPPLLASTDDRGQVTFSGPALVKPLDVTVSADGYETVSVFGLNAANLTVYLYPNEQEPVEMQPGEVKVAELSGRVFGFKDVPGLPSGPTVTVQAMVNLTSWSIYGVPPYSGEPQGIVVDHDGGDWSFTLRLGNYSVYAVYGAYDEETGQFTPGLLGVRRNITLASEEPVTGQDIILSTPLDRIIPLHLVEPPPAPQGRQVQYGVYASLDLGFDGVIYLGSASGSSTELLLERMPEAAGDSFLMVGLASVEGSYPLSYVFRRQSGDVYSGVDVGPFLGFIEITYPENNGTLDQPRLAWQVQGRQPQFFMVLLQSSDLVPVTLWRLIVPGDVREVEIPPEVMDGLPRGQPVLLLIYGANSPRFEFDRFNYSQLGTSRWLAYTVQFAGFTVP